MSEKKGGWCPDCEKEGKDPKHKYHTVLCPKHYQRRRLAGTLPPRPKNRGGWCPECEKEGKDPRHKNRTILCPRHYQRAYLRTEKGKAAQLRYLRSEKGRATKKRLRARDDSSRSPIEIAIERARRETENS